MQLTQFTDLGLRVLMYLTPSGRAEPITINELANAFGVSRHNLVKVVHFMAQRQWLVTTRGKGGGLSLAKPMTDYRLGELIRQLEGSFELAHCNALPCVLRGGCELNHVLNKAVSAFFEVLDACTLADLMQLQTQKTIGFLHQKMLFPTL